MTEYSRIKAANRWAETRGRWYVYGFLPALFAADLYCFMEVLMSFTEDELFEDVKYWKGRAEAAESELESLRADLADAQSALRGAKLLLEKANSPVRSSYGVD